MDSAGGVPLIDRAGRFSGQIAVVDPVGEFTYDALLERTELMALALLRGREDLEEEPICFLTPPGIDYVATQWAIWRAGGIAVPLCDRHPLPEIEHVVADTGAGILVVQPHYADRLLPLARKSGIELLLTTDLPKTESNFGISTELPEISPNRRAMILYTSGSTGKPKGVVTTHSNIEAQVLSLVEAWGWQADDRILNVLPLHHVHGIINVLSCALWSGAVCEFQPMFDAEAVWNRFQRGGLTLFMAVPTIYFQLIEFWENSSPSERKSMSAACRELRLMVSGSAALPLPIFEKWRQISGQSLLERYGMTEIGMALSNPLQGERRPGYVGNPLPGVEVRITGEDGKEVEEGLPGQIEVKGPSVFLEYWRQPDVTKAAFRGGWFLTGDIALQKNGAYRILGRANVDIIKTGGYKVSALEVENVLLEHPAIREAAVVGVADERWGEQVCAAVVLKETETAPPSGEDLRRWTKKKLAHYKAPARFGMVKSFPRNTMGKVVKASLRNLFIEGGEE